MPLEDFDRSLLTPTDHTTHCPFKGDATYWSIGDHENVLWGYEEPIESASWLRGYVAPYWDRFDAWYEEDELLQTKFRDPYHRIDVRETAARVRVRAGGETVAESGRARLLFETGIEPRAYVSLEDVRQDLLTPSDKHTVCPYKGTASYWSVNGVEDAAWSYRDPIPEAGAIEGLVSFKGDGIEVEIDRSYAASTSAVMSRTA